MPLPFGEQLGGSGGAADVDLVRLDVSYLPRSGQLSSEFAMVGTTDMAVARSSWMVFRTCTVRSGGPSPV